jgi:DNA-binding HxlR family transcriptional regulator
MSTQPHRSWSGRELAERLQITPRNLHTQLGEWAKLGFITRTGFATYALNTPPAQAPSTTAPDP